MSHRVYEASYGTMRIGTAPDNMALELGAIDLGGRDASTPIDAIDWDKQLYRRRLGEWQPFPAHWHEHKDVVWDAEAL